MNHHRTAVRPGRTAGYPAQVGPGPAPAVRTALGYRLVPALRRRIGLVVMASLVAACTPRIELDMAAGPRLNPGPEGEPLPVLLRVYQLDGRKPFEDVDRAALARDDEAVLGDWLQRRELVLRPGAHKEVELEMADGADYLALAVFYLDHEAERWRLLESLPGSVLGMRPGQRLTLALDGGMLWVGAEAERKRATWRRDDARASTGRQAAGL